MSENQSTVEEGKTMAIISYITFIGLIIAFVVNKDKKNSFTNYHIKQSLGIVVISFALSILGFVLAMVAPKLTIITSILNLVVFVAIILGIIAAAKGEEKPLPVMGEKFNEMFKNI